MKKVFITRELQPNSPLLALDCQVFGASLIAFKAIPYSRIPPADWLFFYSPNGVKFFFETFYQQKKTHDQLPQKYAAIGQGTAEAFQKYNIKPDFVGDGVPDSTAQKFNAIAHQQSVIFVQAQHSHNSIATILGDKITAIPLIVYENTPITNIVIPDADILVFTSPLNVTAFLNIQAISHQEIIAIGETTADFLRQNGISNIQVPIQPSEKEITNTIQKILANHK